MSYYRPLGSLYVCHVIFLILAPSCLCLGMSISWKSLSDVLFLHPLFLSLSLKCFCLCRPGVYLFLLILVSNPASFSVCSTLLRPLNHPSLIFRFHWFWSRLNITLLVKNAPSKNKSLWVQVLSHNYSWCGKY